MEKSFKTPEEYINALPDKRATIMRAIRETIRKAAPEATEAIKYGMPTFVQNGNLVHYAAHKHHIGFYPAPSGIIEFREELAGYHTSKGAIQFPLENDIPYDLISDIVKFRVAENTEKKRRK